MNVGAIVGFILAGFSVLFVIGNLVTSYRTKGGSLGQVPVMAPPVFGPAYATIGLLLASGASEWPDWPWWGFGLFWSGFTLTAWYATLFAGKLGAKGKEADDLDS